MDLDLQLLDAVVRIRTDDADLMETLSRLWSAFPSPDRPVEDEVEILRQPEGWRMSLFGGMSFVNPHRSVIEDHLAYHLEELALRRTPSVLGLHAAAVADADGALILPAPSGGGKTTLTLSLIGEGWTFLSDDLTPLGRSSGLVKPFPRAMRIRAPNQPGADVRESSQDEAAPTLLAPPASMDSLGVDAPPRWVVFPQFSAHSRLQLEEVSPGEATLRLAQFARTCEPADLRLIADLCSSARNFTLSYGDSKGALEGVMKARGLK